MLLGAKNSRHVAFGQSTSDHEGIVIRRESKKRYAAIDHMKKHSCPISTAKSGPQYSSALPCSSRSTSESWLVSIADHLVCEGFLSHWEKAAERIGSFDYGYPSMRRVSEDTELQH